MIGFAAGLFSIIPMVGSAVGLVVGIAVAWFQTSDLVFVAMVGGVFAVGQLIEGNFLTPKLVGDNVGLHPLWVFFALFAGGSLLGLLGMFLAVPVAAVVGVLLSFALRQYKASEYYKGTGNDVSAQN
jgi:predicted PurR-regulated permease PerM